MTRRSIPWLVGLALLLLLLDGSHPQATSAGEEPAAEADLLQLLEGFAPLVPRGEWTRTVVKDSPATAFDDLPRETQRGLQDVLALKFAAPDRSRTMLFGAARFETSAEAATFLAAYHEALLEQLRRSASAPGASVWLDDVSEGAGKDGALDGHAIDWVVEMFESPFRITFQHFHVGRLFVSLTLGNCSHVSRETQDAFIAYALERVTNPALDPPPSPALRVPTREVTFRLRGPAGEPVARAQATVRAVGRAGAGPATHLLDRGVLTLPQEPLKIRVGDAAGQDGKPLPLLSEEIVVAPRQTEVTVTLRTGDPCRIRVVGPDGEPVPGAAVRTLSRRLDVRPRIRIRVAGETLPEEEHLSPVGDGRGTTDAGGEVRLAVDPRLGSKIVVDAGEDHFPVVEEVPPGTRSRTIRLRPAWVLHLVVRDCDGTPVEDDLEVRVAGETRYVETDATGRARIGPLPRETVHVATFRDLSGQDAWTEVAPTREPVVLTLTSHVLRLRVVDAAGAEVPGYWVDVRTDLRAYGSAAEGPTALLLPASPCSVEVRKATDGDGRALNLAAARATVRAWMRELTLHMSPGLKVAGTVRTEAGRPVEGAEVWAGHHYDVHARTRTDAEGRYELVGLDEGVFTVHVEPPEGLAPPRPRDVRPTSSGAPVDLTLPPVVPVTVLDWSGLPVRGAWVRVEVVGDGPESGTYPIEDHTGEDGIAYLANLYADQVLHVMPQNAKDLASLRRPWDGSPVSLELERAHTVRVRVVDGAGPVVGAILDVEEGEDLPRDTGPEGRADVVLPYRPVRLRAQRSPRAAWSAWVRVEPRDVEVEVRVPDARR